MFESSLLLSLVFFAFITSISPGPNNMMLTASGANFGFKRTIPHMLGIVTGVAVMIVVMGSGLGALFYQFPALQWALKTLGSLYLLYIAFKISQMGVPGDANSKAKPMTFLQAALFQWLNPKAWVMCSTAVTSFTITGPQYWLSLVLIALAFFIVEIPTTSFWAAFGTKVKTWLNTPQAWRKFNLTMGGLTASCVLMMWL